MHKLDELDIKILEELRKDGRLSNVEIARIVGTSEGTVRRRIENLIKSKVAEVTAVLNPQEIGYDVAVHVNLQVELNKLESIITALAQFENVNYIALLTGEFDVMFNGLFHSSTELREFIVTKLANIEGIRNIQTSYVLQEVKRTNYWVPLAPYSLAEDQAILLSDDTKPKEG